MGRTAAVLSLLHERGSAQEIGQVHGDGTGDHHAAASEQLVPSTNAYPATGAGSSQEEVRQRRPTSPNSEIYS